MESRVGALELTIRGERPVVERVRPDAEAFAIRVLERCDEILDRRHPGRVFVLPHLDLHVRMSERDFDGAEVDALAAAIVDRVAGAARPPGDAGLDDDVVTFTDVADWYAWSVEACVRGTPDKTPSIPSSGEAPSSIQALLRDPPLLREVLLRLHRRGTLLKMLEPLSDDVAAAIARVLAPPLIAEAPESPTPDGELPESVARCVREIPLTASAALAWIAMATAARNALGPSHAEAVVRNVAYRGLSTFLRRRSTQVSEVDAGGSDDSISDSRTESDNGPGECDSAASVLNRAGADPLGDGESTSVASAFGGVFYLLRLVMELSLGESLWRACLPEGLVMSKAVRMLLGDEAEGDPAPLVFGGVASSETLPPVSAEQQQEVSHAVFAALVDALLRREAMASWEPVLHLVDTAHGRLLVASTEPGSYVLFALPADSSEEIVAAIDSFLAIWPASAPRPCAGQALAALDRRGRIRPRAAASRITDAVVVAGSGSLCMTALLMQAAGVLACLSAACLGVEDQPTRDLVARYFRIAALVATTPETLDVRMPIEAVNLDVRRAALDADPGWIPWLRRRVSITFDEEPDSAGAASAS